MVENRIAKDDSVFIVSPTPILKPLTCLKKDIASNLKIDIRTIDSRYPISIINAGLTTLIVPIELLDAILTINPNMENFKEFCVQSDIDIIEVFTSDVANKSNHFRTRVFAPRFGYLEDPATGSGNSALGYYLLQEGMFHKEILTLEQNGDRERYNEVKIKQWSDEQGVDRVMFGGGAMTRIEGRYFLY